MTDRPITPAENVIVLASVLALIVMLPLCGCGGAPGIARRSVEVATVVLLDTDQRLATEYTDAARRALEHSATLVEYRGIMNGWDAAETAVRVTQTAILAADASLDAWDAGGSARWVQLAACLVAALIHLRDALATIELRAPPELDSAIELARPFAIGACNG